jgi:hypothetical protein
MNAQYWRGQRVTMEKFASSLLHKQALDAMKARGMAKSVGLVPHPGSQWKWALRNMRDGQGNLLPGRELAEAKEGLGKMPNNVRQKLQSMSRATGHRYEVGTVLNDDPEWTKEFSNYKFKVFGEKDKFKQMLRDKLRTIQETQGSLPQADGKVPGEAMSKLLETGKFKRFVDLKDSQRGNFYIGYEHGIRGPYMEKLTDPLNTASVHTHPFNSAAKFDSNPEVSRTGINGPSLVSPSAHPDNFKQQIKDYAAENNGEQLFSGDYGGDYQIFQELPHMKHNIYDPNFGNEGVHKARPQGMRSVYFQNQANATLDGMPKYAELLASPMDKIALDGWSRY